MTVVPSQFDLDMLARTVWLEAEGEPDVGKLAVAYTVVNRTNSGKWFGGSTIAATVMKREQYSGWNSDKTNATRREQACSVGVEKLDSCMHAAILATTGAQPDPTDGCTHYHAQHVSPPWAVGRAPAVVIGRHLFYKGVP